MRTTAFTKIKWYQMMNIKNCNKNSICNCADELRKAILAIPIDKYDEKRLNFIINDRKYKYNKCFNDDNL